MKKEDKYMWYLKEPFNKIFDRSNWWNEIQYSNQKSDVSALYELARRHPDIGRLKLKNSSVKDQSNRRNWLCSIGHKKWISLTPDEVKHWRTIIGKIKGIDVRSHETIYTNYSDGALQEALEELFGEFNGSSFTRKVDVQSFGKPSMFMLDCINNLTKPFTMAVNNRITDKTNNPIVHEIERRIAERAIKDYRLGRIILSISPDLSYEKARKVLSTAYKEHKKPPASKQRSRWEDWLHKIKAYQDYQLQSRIKNPHLCTNYKRLFKNLDI